MARIFISYGRSTAPQARRVADGLRALDHDVWIDDQLLAHRSFADAIEEQLDASDAVVVLWSPDAARSEWVRAEASRGRAAGKLVQVMLERCALPMPFDQIHCAKLFDWEGDSEVSAWASVVASVDAVLNPSGFAWHTKAAAAPSHPAESRTERRQVTVLSCDLEDSGALSRRLDPEDMMQVIEVWQAACDDIIAHHGGAIVRTAGHGVLAYFGYPRADEEAAANAVRAGLALSEAIRGLDLPIGGPLRAQVGVATGLVVIGDLTSPGGRHETGVAGDTPNLALQLQRIAPPDGVVVSEATQRITEGLFVYREFGQPILPGYDAPAPAFQATATTDARTRSQARRQKSQTSLIGREAELAQIFEAWALAQEGEGQVVLVQGEAGIGKSRLIDAFRASLADGPVPSIWYCAPNYADSALHPVAEQLAHAAGFDDDDAPESRRAKLGALLERYGVTLAEHAAVLAELLGVPADPGRLVLTPDKRKAVTLDALIRIMEQAARDNPAVFVIEDLHWADPTTLEMLQHATQQAAQHPWLILATARPEFECGWSDHADVVQVQLSRLDAADAARICGELGAAVVLPGDMVKQIVARSDGVPLFVEEITKAVLESMAGASTASGVARVAIPNTLQDSLAARLDRLGSAKQVASLAAAIGRRFSYSLLAAVAPQEPPELREALRALTRAGLLERTGVPPSSNYLFKHALIRDAAYDSLLKKERQALHGRIAAALREQRTDAQRAEPALLAYHLTESGAIAEAIPVWVEAGQRAAAQAAHVEAVSHLQTALDLLRRLPDDPARAADELQILLGLAASLGASRGYSIPEIAVALADARAICARLGEAADLFAVLRGICSFSLNANDVPAAEAAAQSCTEIAERTGLPVHRIEAEHSHGFIRFMKGDLAAARVHLERAVRLYRENDGGALAFPSVTAPLPLCLGVLPLVLFGLGDLAAAEKASADLIGLLPTFGRNYDLVFALCWHATYDVIRRDYHRAADFATQAIAVTEENAYETFRACAMALKALAQGAQFNAAASVEQAAAPIAKLERLGVRNMRTFFLAEFAALQAAAGDVGAALATVDKAIAHALEFQDHYYLSPAHRRRSEILERCPGADPAEAATALAQAIAVAEAQGAAGFAAEARSRLGEPVA
jgi:class 3 adenylate cyclase/tetratricopeptide (TPR) repeat protein